jgi:hypothetical protein
MQFGHEVCSLLSLPCGPQSLRALVPQCRDAFSRAYRYGVKVYGARAITLSAKAIVTAANCDKNATFARESAIP